MLIYFNLLIPIIAILVMLFMFRSRMAIWEYLLIFIIPLVGIIIVDRVSVSSQTFRQEIWNSYLTRAEYYEPWSSWVEKTCQRCHTECEGSGKDEHCHTECENYDCSYCNSNGPDWVAYDNLGRSHGISEDMYNRLCALWGNKTKVELNRNIVYENGCGKDGEMYQTNWDNQFIHIQHYTDVHHYENRVQASRSVFNFQPVDKSDIQFYGLFNYVFDFDPYHYNPIFGISSPDAADRLQKWNALLGNSKKIHMMVLVFVDKTIDAAFMQERLWKGGNKNEFILCIGIDKEKNIKWTKVISWTEKDRLKLDVERSVANMNFNLNDIIDTMATHTKVDWVKRDFREFNYLRIEPTPRAIMICFFITIILTIGLCLFSYFDGFTEEDPTGEHMYERGWHERGRF